MAIASLLLAGPLVSACGGDDQSAVCDDIEALQTSLNSLEAFDIYDTNVLSDLAVVLDQIRTQVGQLAEDASTELSEEVEAAQASTDDLESSADAAVDAPTAANLSTLDGDVDAFSTAFQDLRAAVEDTC